MVRCSTSHQYIFLLLETLREEVNRCFIRDKWLFKSGVTLERTKYQAEINFCCGIKL